MSDNQYVDGLYPKPKSEKAPSFIIGKLSINLEQFMPWVRQWCKDNPGEQWINIEMTTRKSDPSKGTAKLDTWKPDTKPRNTAPSAEDSEPDDLPF